LGGCGGGEGLIDNDWVEGRINATMATAEARGRAMVKSNSACGVEEEKIPWTLIGRARKIKGKIGMVW
jgi:hypothetical protein